MIVSSTGKFVFFHNPKAAGSSVHYALHGFHDNAFPASGRGADGRYLSHYGIDEFAAECPEHWETIGAYHFFALYRDPEQRFLSSFSQYSITEGEIDTRFATTDTARSFLFTVIDRLAKLGSAEAVMQNHEFTLFRPQWIYAQSEHHHVSVSAYAVREIEKMYQAMETRLGATLSRDRINEREAFDLPGPLAALLQRGNLIRRIAGLPGSKFAKSVLAKSFKPADETDKLALSASDKDQIVQFIASFYARDIEWMASLDASGQHQVELA